MSGVSPSTEIRASIADLTGIAPENQDCLREGRPDVGASSCREFSWGIGAVPTISDRVQEVVPAAAAGASVRPLMESWGRGQSREEIVSKVRVELWRTPDGQALRDLDRAHGAKPYSPTAVAQLRESRDAARVAKALEVLDRGLQLPS